MAGPKLKQLVPRQLVQWWRDQFGEELTSEKWLDWRKEMVELFEVIYDSEDQQTDGSASASGSQKPKVIVHQHEWYDSSA